MKLQTAKFLIICFGFWILMLGFSCNGATYTVINTSDSGAGSLRQAIEDSVTNPGADTVAFNIPTSDSGYVTEGGVSFWRIKPSSGLPLVGGASTTIDGQTQTTNQGDTNPNGPEIVIDGSSAGNSSGIVLTADDCVVRNLVINNFTDDGIVIDAANNNDVLGNYVGTNASGSSVIANGGSGVFIHSASSNNNIGDGTSGGRNIVSGNTRDGININDSDSNQIKGNYIGTNASGDAALANGDFGVELANGAGSNQIGGTSSGDRNIISGNTGNGITIGGDNNNVLGNYIGLAADGTTALGNSVVGIYIAVGLSSNNIGNGTSAGRNVISANGDNGIEIVGSGTNSNEVNNNYIGTDANGSEVAGLENGAVGIWIGDFTSSTKVLSCKIKTGSSGIFMQGGADYQISENVIIGSDVSVGIVAGDSNSPSGEIGTGTISTNEVRGFNIGIQALVSNGNTLTSSHNTMVKNDNGASQAVGIEVVGGTVIVRNSIISSDPTGNSIPSYSVGILQDGGELTVAYSDIYGNNQNYDLNGGTITRIATIHANAKFVDSANNDFNLNYNSPCVNFGTPEGTDMGVYQYLGATPEVRVISPNGGENWKEGTIHYVTWHASSDVVSIDLYYSIDGGLTYSTITTGLSNSGSYLWRIPDGETTSARVRVVANSPTRSATDESDSNFAIDSKFVRVVGPVLTYPTRFRAIGGGSCKIAYRLNIDEDVKIYLINKYGKIHWSYQAAAGTAGGTAGYNEVEFDGNSYLSQGYAPNGLYMIKIVSQNKVIGTGYLMIID